MNMHGISRIDADRAVGWYVRIYYGGDKEHRKFFSDSLHGGSQKGHAAAIAYRDKILAENPPPKKLPFRIKPMPKNTTGYNGISKTFRRSGNRKIKYDVYGVFYAPEPGKVKTKYFYFHHYPNQLAALNAAIDFRKEKETEILERWNKLEHHHGKYGFYTEQPASEG
jgi:hypothetical protein